MHVEYKANVLFNLFVAGLLGVAEQKPIALLKGRSGAYQRLGRMPGLQDLSMAENLLRVLTPCLKGHCSKTAISGLQECMECMGGVGYLENDDMQYNIARLYRDANVMPIWEGTTDMMADDAVLRVIFGKTGKNVMGSFETWTHSMLERFQHNKRCETQVGSVKQWWHELKTLVAEASKEEAEMKCRAVMDRLVDVVQGLLLLLDAASDNDEVAWLAADSWFLEKLPGARLAQQNWEGQAAADVRLVFGTDDPSAIKARL